MITHGQETGIKGRSNRRMGAREQREQAEDKTRTPGSSRLKSQFRGMGTFIEPDDQV